MLLSEIIDRLGMSCALDNDVEITHAASLGTAGEGAIAFLGSSSHLKALASSNASAIVVSQEHAVHCDHSIALVADNPHKVFAKILELIYKKSVQTGTHPSASVAASAVVASSASIAQNVVIGEGSTIADNVIIGPNSVIGNHVTVEHSTTIADRVSVLDNTVMGHHCRVFSGAVIGSDGFGFANDKGEWYRVPQVGAVQIGNHVDIGANSTIDCGAIDDTIIADGVKIDDQVHIAHNVKIGKHTVIAGCVGIAGSTEIGAYCAFGGQCGIAGHIKIADGVVVTGMTMVAKSIDKPGRYASGVPALPATRWHRIYAKLKKLEEMYQRVTHLEKVQNDK